MPRVPHHQHSFITGEIHPRIIGRYDLERMQSAVKTCRNWLITRHGPVVRRPGTRYITDVKTSANFTRMIPFVASDDAQYALEFGNTYVRFYRDDGQLQSSPGTATERSTPYVTSVLPNLKYAQQDDTLFIASGSVQLQRLRRLSTADTLNASWSVSNASIADGPYLDINSTSTTVTLDPTSGSVGATVTVTASSPIFEATDANATTALQRLIRIRVGNIWLWGRITAFTSSTVVQIGARRAYSDATATTEWRLGAFSETTGWPSAVSVFQDRLWLSGGSVPNAIYASRIGRYLNFTPTSGGGLNVLDDDAITLELNSEKQERVQHLSVTSRGLAAYTSSGMFIIQNNRSSGETYGLSPTSISASKQHTRGSTIVKPVMIDNDILHVDSSTARMHRARYEFNFDSWRPEDISVFSDHLLRPGILDMAYQQNPEPVIWIATDASTNNLLSLTYETDQGVVGWAKHDVSGKVESVAVIRTDNLDRVYMTVLRTIGGNPKRSVEILTHPFGLDQLSDECICLDAAVQGENNTGSPITVLSGLSHLNGLPVFVVVDDTNLYGPLTPSGVNGDITVPVAIPAGKSYYVGLPYNSDLEMLPVHVVGNDPIYNNKKRVVMAFPRYRDARNMRIGEDLTNTFIIPETAGTVLRNGIATVNIKTQPDLDNGIVFRQIEPWPTMLMSVGMEVEVGGP